MSESLVFSAWRGWFDRRPVVTVAATLTGLRRCTLDKLEERFAPLLAGPGMNTVQTGMAASTAAPPKPPALPLRPSKLKRHSPPDGFSCMHCKQTRPEAGFHLQNERS